jgi:peptidoglycan hydrolase CwlO-like protein
VGGYAARTDEAQKDLSTRAVAMEKGLASVEGDLAELRSLPTSLRDLEAATHRLDQATSSTAGRLDDLQRQVGAVDQKVDALLARPACSAAVVVAAPKVATSATPDAGPRPASSPATDGGTLRANP